jgi:hypothetical protein
LEAEKCDIYEDLLSEEEEEVLIQRLGNAQCDEHKISAVLNWARLVRLNDICLRLLLSNRAIIKCDDEQIEIISKLYELTMSMIDDYGFEYNEDPGSFD